MLHLEPDRGALENRHGTVFMGIARVMSELDGNNARGNKGIGLPLFAGYRTHEYIILADLGQRNIIIRKVPVIPPA